MNNAHTLTTENAALRHKLEARVRGKAKPIGALGRLETLAVQIGMVTGSLSPDLGAARVVVFAGDHGITAEGVTAYPSVVTAEIAKIMLAGGAGINVCARAAGVDVLLVDAGLLSPLPPHANLLDRRIGTGTKNARREPAMSVDECASAYAKGQAISRELASQGAGIIAFGEVGIGNTSAAALVGHCVTDIELGVLIGPGAGAPALGLDHKRTILAETLARAAITTDDPKGRAFEALRQFAGFEMVMMAGAMTAAASKGCVIVVDGFIATSVAAAAVAIEPAMLQNCVFAHCSAEPGHSALLRYLNAEPLFDLGLRLGEGTGAALAIPFVRAAEGLMRDMADLPGEHPE
jgi:nicotinate-nucleotide--dimethylbenzimidazole phosphoribosyltransferase